MLNYISGNQFHTTLSIRASDESISLIVVENIVNLKVIEVQAGNMSCAAFKTLWNRLSRKLRHKDAQRGSRSAQQVVIELHTINWVSGAYWSDRAGKTTYLQHGVRALLNQFTSANFQALTGFQKELGQTCRHLCRNELLVSSRASDFKTRPSLESDKLK